MKLTITWIFISRKMPYLSNAPAVCYGLWVGEGKAAACIDRRIIINTRLISDPRLSQGPSLIL